jgi:methylated-DNA-[protein]-cysteine S-methyltransferase
MSYFAKSYNSPIGVWWLIGTERWLLKVGRGEEFIQKMKAILHPLSFEKWPLPEALEELEGYFRGEIKTFKTPLLLEGTFFQKEVWRKVKEIPWGETRTYGEMAKAIGKSKALRAVGRALGANPLPIFIPCHRVISKRGLGGFSLGLEVKIWLLKHEGVFHEP